MTDDGRVWRCGTGARWLPRVLGASTLAAGLVAGPSSPEWLNLSVAAAGALTALWIVRRGAELRLTVELGEDELRLRAGSRSRVIPFDRIDGLSYEAPFGPSRSWLSATIVRQSEGSAWRVPAYLEDGGGWVVELVRRSGRNDLEAWSRALALERRMGRVSLRLRVGYATAAAVLIGGGVLRLG